MHIGFIGLGNMGAPMARNLLKAGYTLSVFDLNTQVMEALAQAGALPAESPTAIARGNADVIITMLPAAPHVRSVYLGDDGLIQNVRPGVLLIDSSTIDPHSARDVAAVAAQHGNPMLDAPVSGGEGGAIGGEGPVRPDVRARQREGGKSVLIAGDLRRPSRTESP